MTAPAVTQTQLPQYYNKNVKTENEPQRGYILPAQNDDWQTPAELWHWLRQQYGDLFDPCPVGWQPGDPNGLTTEWGRRNYVNPPYRDNKAWFEKAWREYEKGKLVVMLIPSRTDTAYWHKYAMHASDLYFIRGRLKFTLNGGRCAPAPFASCIVVFDPEGSEPGPRVHPLDLRGGTQ